MILYVPAAFPPEDQMFEIFHLFEVHLTATNHADEPRKKGRKLQVTPANFPYGKKILRKSCLEPVGLSKGWAERLVPAILILTPSYPRAAAELSRCQMPAQLE